MSSDFAVFFGGYAVKKFDLSLALAPRLLFNCILDAGISRINEVGWFFLR